MKKKCSNCGACPECGAQPPYVVQPYILPAPYVPGLPYVPYVPRPHSYRPNWYAQTSPNQSSVCGPGGFQGSSIYRQTYNAGMH